MGDSDEDYSDPESVGKGDDSEDEVNVSSERHNVDAATCSSEDEVDDRTLFRSFKILRRMSKAIGGNIPRGGVRTRSSKSAHVAAETSSPLKHNAEAGSSNALSRCNHSYFRDIIVTLDRHQKDVISNCGFGVLLNFDGSRIPRNFVEWIAEHIDENCMDINVGGKVIPLSALSVHKVLGIPIGGSDISETGESRKNEFLNLLNMSSIPLIKTFGMKILGEELSDEDLLRCFMVVALSTFLCPNSSTKPSPKYLTPLIDVASIQSWDWSKFVFDWLVKSVKKYKKRRQSLGGCIYFLAVYYLDFLDFGANNVLPSTIPRINVWKRSLLKNYISYDSLGGGQFGKRPVKNVAETCYCCGSGSVPNDQLRNFKQSLQERFGYLPAHIIDGMCGVFEGFLVHGFEAPNYSPDQLVLSIFQFLQDSNGVGAGSENMNVGGTNVNQQMSENQYSRRGCPNDFSEHFSGNQNFAHVCPDNNDDVNAAEDDRVTEKVGTNDSADSGDGNCASQATVIIPSEDSASKSKVDVSVPGKRGRKRKTSTSSPQSDSSDSIASRTRRRCLRSSKRIGKSPLCGEGGSKENPIIAEDVNVKESRAEGFKSIYEALEEVERKHQEYDRLKQLKKDQAAAAAKSGKVAAKSGKKFASDLKEKVSEPKPSSRKGPYFNSPSIPSFRIFDDEDDLGNFVADPSERRPVGPHDFSSLHRQRSNINSESNVSASSSARQFGEPDDEPPVQDNVEPEDAIHMESIPFTDETSEEFHLRRKSEAAAANPDLRLSSSPVGGELEVVPLAIQTPEGVYVDLSQESLRDDVVVTGTKTFAERCSEFSNESDKFYNWSFSSYDDGSGSSFGRMPVYRGRRFAAPSKFVSSPYVNEHNKISVSAKERDIYRVLLCVCHSNHSSKEIIDYKHVRVQFGSLGSSLSPGGSVETYVVNALCKKMFDTKHPSKSFKHYFFTPVADFLLNIHVDNEEKRKSLYVKALKSFKGAHGAKSLYNSNMLYFPMFYNNHWSLIVCVIKERKLVVLDPCVKNFGPSSGFHQHVKDVFVDNFLELWEQTARMDIGLRRFEFVFADVPQSSKIEDEGVFMMKYLEEWDPLVNIKLKFDESDISNIRIKYVNEMIFSESNNAYEGLNILKSYDDEVFSKYFQGEG